LHQPIEEAGAQPVVGLGVDARGEPAGHRRARGVHAGDRRDELEERTRIGIPGARRSTAAVTAIVADPRAIVPSAFVV
jgi:hypothetical protein